ncbi:hypothetical protein HYH03_016352 [Edaphochlamys debaryana]|uniref:VDE lipocalin domain-containing protein n=1 Tax=Edaphochlamys debaryana TaxID=47281 RepID=A0A835XME1_9CHLO|nr:hypothetical protein HYH03_016352 [Edaphochlamys debaryana]|eukprot:KAG2484866.1 hypothetical protein HYH03_016352 [Edaphochlamys debaryana]
MFSTLWSARPPGSATSAKPGPGPADANSRKSLAPPSKNSSSRRPVTCVSKGVVEGAHAGPSRSGAAGCHGARKTRVHWASKLVDSEAQGVAAAVSSHEITLSDLSDTDTSHPVPLPVPTPASRHTPSRRSPSASRAPAPAAALSNQTLLSARRRALQQGPTPATVRPHVTPRRPAPPATADAGPQAQARTAPDSRSGAWLGLGSALTQIGTVLLLAAAVAAVARVGLAPTSHTAVPLGGTHTRSSFGLGPGPNSASVGHHTVGMGSPAGSHDGGGGGGGGGMGRGGAFGQAAAAAAALGRWLPGSWARAGAAGAAVGASASHPRSQPGPTAAFARAGAVSGAVAPGAKATGSSLGRGFFGRPASSSPSSMGGSGGGGRSAWPAPHAQGPAGMSAVAAAAGGGGGPEQEWRESAQVRVITITSGAASPYRTTWDAVADHTAQRLEWTDPGYQMLVFRQEELGGSTASQRAFLRALEGGAHMVVGLDVTDGGAEAFLRDPSVASRLPGVAVFLGGSPALAEDLTRLQGGLKPQDPTSWRTQLARKLSWTPDGAGVAVWDTVQLLMSRHDSDNFLFVFLVLINQYVTTVRQVADTTKGFDLSSIICMVKHCGQKVVNCVQDPTCKGALDCLNACTFNDQVCQYRCIVSYENPLLGEFTLCILQLHNCRNLDAKPPLLPDPAPMPSFRGTPLTHEAAEDLLIGWLDQPGQGAPAGALLGERKGKVLSWLVAGGKNPAYDYFPCQHQLFYRGKGKNTMWYEPVFKAITLDGREVWRRRVYRVRRGKVPGTFHLSVLDNGVTSNEFWRLVDCDEDLAWCLFYYSGAASTAGLSYSGAVLGTPDGAMPAAQHTPRLHAALRRSGIEPWELSYVDNSGCEEAPLGITGPVPAPALA